jgi:hypothetical protein
MLGKNPTKNQVLLEYEDLVKKHDSLKLKHSKLEETFSAYKIKAKEQLESLREGYEEQLSELNTSLEEKQEETPYTEYNETELVVRLKADRDKGLEKNRRYKHKIRKLEKQLK